MGDCLRDPLIKNGESRSDAQRLETSGKLDSEQSEDSLLSATPPPWTWIWEEFEQQFWIAAPMIIVGMLQFAVSVVSVSFVGHLGELELASSSVATSFAGVTGYTLLIGMSTTLETLCGQAFGAKQYRSVGIYLQRAILALNAVAIIIAIIWANTGVILRALQQDPEISDRAGQYARWMIPTAFAYATVQPVTRYIQIQSAVFPMACCSALTLGLHVPICWSLTSGVGYLGAAVANGISQWLNLLFLVIYIKFSPKFETTWTGFSVEAFQGMKEFLWLALPSAMMICLEYWCFEMLVLVAGLLPDPQLEMSTFSISLVMLSLLYMVPFGLSAAASTRVSNELGAGKPSAAKRAVAFSISAGVCEGIIIFTLFWTLRHLWPYAFTGEQKVVDYIGSWTFLAFVPLFDCFQTVLGAFMEWLNVPAHKAFFSSCNRKLDMMKTSLDSSVLSVIRGSGRQHLGAYTNLGAYYGVGLPLAITFSFYLNMRGKGLWFGLMSASVVQGVSLGLITYFTNWEEQARRARDLVAGDRLPTEKVLS